MTLNAAVSTLCGPESLAKQTVRHQEGSEERKSEDRGRGNLSPSSPLWSVNKEGDVSHPLDLGAYSMIYFSDS